MFTALKILSFTSISSLLLYIVSSLTLYIISYLLSAVIKTSYKYKYSNINSKLLDLNTSIIYYIRDSVYNLYF